MVLLSRYFGTNIRETWRAIKALWRKEDVNYTDKYVNPETTDKSAFLEVSDATYNTNVFHLSEVGARKAKMLAALRSGVSDG